MQNQKTICWIPHIYALSLISFVSLFALDVFGSYETIGETVFALFIHLIPSYILIGFNSNRLALALAGGMLFVVLGASFLARHFFIASLVILGGLLFVWSAEEMKRLQADQHHELPES